MSPEIGKFSLTSHKLFQDGICCVVAPHNRIPCHGRHWDHRQHPCLRRYLQVEQMPAMWWPEHECGHFKFFLFKTYLSFFWMITTENLVIYSKFSQIYPLKVLNEISKRKFSHKVFCIKLMIELNSTTYIFSLWYLKWCILEIFQ